MLWALCLPVDLPVLLISLPYTASWFACGHEDHGANHALPEDLEKQVK
jgi:hypothetical protein